MPPTGGPYGGAMGPPKASAAEWAAAFEAVTKSAAPAQAGTALVAESLAKLTRQVTPLNAASTLLGGGMGQLQRAIASISSQVAGFVQAWNPAAVARFQFAVTDLNATIGRALAPTLEKLTRLVRGVADGLASLGPSGQRMIAALAVATVGMAAMTGAALAVSAAVNSATFGLSALLGAVAGGVAGMAFVMKDMAGVQGLAREAGRLLTVVLNTLGDVAGRVAGRLAESLAGLSAVAPGVLGAVAGMADVFADVLVSLAGPLGTLLGAAVQLGAAIQAMQLGVLGAAVEVLGVLAQALTPVLDAVVALVGVGLQPLRAAMAPLQLAAALLSAALTPFRVAVEVLTLPLRLAAAVAGAVGRAFAPVVEVFQEVAALAGDVAKAVGELVGDVFADLADGLVDFVAGALDGFVRAIRDAAEFVRGLVRAVRDLLGLTPAADTFRGGASDGMGIRNTRIGSGESALADLSRAALTSAFQLGTVKKEDPAQKSVSILDQIHTKMGRVTAFIDGIETTFKEFIASPIGAGAVGAAAGWARGAAETGADMGLFGGAGLLARQVQQSVWGKG